MNDDKKDITITDRKYKNESGQERKYYRYLCNICNKENGWVREDLIEKDKFICKHSKYIYNTKNEKGNNKIPITTPWLIPYFQGGYDEAKLYTRCSSQKIYPICPDCGKIKDRDMSIYTIYYSHSIGCTCGEGLSYPNKFMYSILTQLNFYFINEYSPNWIKFKRYDFYTVLNGKEYMIEMDGALHNNDNFMNGQTKEESKAIDDYKDKLALEHGIEVIRIDCDYKNINNRFKYIKQNISNNKRLNEIFDLSNINWKKCDEYSCSNLIKIACEYKKNNPNLKIEDISILLNVSLTTLLNWIEKGKGFGWC